MGAFTDLLGTMKNTFKIGKAKLDASGLSASRTLTVPDRTDTLATQSDITTLQTQADETFAIAIWT